MTQLDDKYSADIIYSRLINVAAELHERSTTARNLARADREQADVEQFTKATECAIIEDMNALLEFFQLVLEPRITN